MKQGQIYHLKQDRVGKPRPVLIVSRDSMNRGYDLIVVPFNGSDFENKRSKPFCVPFLEGSYGLTKDCVAKCNDIAKIRKADLAKNLIGTVSDADMNAVREAINWCLEPSS